MGERKAEIDPPHKGGGGYRGDVRAAGDRSHRERTEDGEDRRTPSETGTTTSADRTRAAARAERDERDPTACQCTYGSGSGGGGEGEGSAAAHGEAGRGGPTDAIRT